VQHYRAWAPVGVLAVRRVLLSFHLHCMLYPYVGSFKRSPTHDLVIHSLSSLPISTVIAQQLVIDPVIDSQFSCRCMLHLFATFASDLSFLGFLCLLLLLVSLAAPHTEQLIIFLFPLGTFSRYNTFTTLRILSCNALVTNRNRYSGLITMQQMTL